MSDFIGDRQCVTHHYACDCREADYDRLGKENKDLQAKLDLARAALIEVTDECAPACPDDKIKIGIIMKALQKIKDSEVE